MQVADYEAGKAGKIDVGYIDMQGFNSHYDYKISQYDQVR